MNCWGKGHTGRDPHMMVRGANGAVFLNCIPGFARIMATYMDTAPTDSIQPAIS